MIKDEGKYYLYRHIRLDTNQVFYVGIGTKFKEKFECITNEYQRAYNKKGRSSFWKSIVNKTDYKVEILLESNNYNFIQNKEIEFISLYGRRDLGFGTLVNHTNGGDGTSGWIPSAEFRKNLSERMKGVPRTAEEKEKLSIAHTGKTISEEAKRKSSISHTGKKLSQEAKDKLSIARKGVKKSEETKRKMSEGSKGSLNSCKYRYIQKNLEGEILHVFENGVKLRDAGFQQKSIYEYLKHNKKHYRGFLWETELLKRNE